MLEAKRFVGDVVKERNEDGRMEGVYCPRQEQVLLGETWWRRKGDDERGAAADEDGHVDCGGPALVEGKLIGNAPTARSLARAGPPNIHGLGA
jgi:hypothetical protein